ncbi:hypothetical protein ISS42_01040 [Candidatus Shapirobacteria bacterium]|nr:hypothetical protein [Candidatus Shapirobacteria bacterium]
MKKKEKELLRTKALAGLRLELQNRQKNLVMELMSKAQGKGKNVKKARKLKKEIAVIKTIIVEKQLKGKK